MSSNAHQSSGAASSSLALVERTDIHKSCKALELVVNVFNDYCQAAEALAVLQKKLAKAVKDAAGCKGTGEVAVNGLSAVTAVFESLSEVEAKFVKAADRECEGTSNEIKKWFKKLAKEEKTHDERIAALNAKIKQAGQTYEKKAKRKDRDAADEHTRYVNLLSLVGPEMAQEKYNHSLFVTQKHTATLNMLVAALTRTAEAEWARACDSVRRMSSVVGRVGECRAYLEGGWVAAIPTVDEKVRDDEMLESETADVKGQGVEGDRGEAKVGLEATKAELQRPPSYYSPAPSVPSSETPSAASSQIPPSSVPTSPLNLKRKVSNQQEQQATPPPPTSFARPFGNTNATNTDSVRSIESLSSFPAPPTHFPLPSLQKQAATLVAVASADQPKGNNSPISPLFTSASSNTIAGSDTSATTVSFTESPNTIHASLRSDVESTPALTDDSGYGSGRSPEQPRDSDKPTGGDGKRGGEEEGGPGHRDASSDHKAIDVKRMVERTESVASSNSIVASMRDKLNSPPSHSKDRDREMPRLSYRVSDLVSKYGPAGNEERPVSPISPRPTGSGSAQQGSPIFGRYRSSPVDERRQLDPEPSSPTVTQQSSTQGAASMSTPPPIGQQQRTRTYSNQGGGGSFEDISARRRHIEELEELELREHAHALRERERQLEARTLELERERLRLLTLGVGARVGAGSSDRAANGVRPHSQHSYSMTNLVPVPEARGTAGGPVRPLSQYGEPLTLAPSLSSDSSSSATRPTDHASYCGCDSCASAQYGAQNRAGAVPNIPAAKSDKPKGWMRRLSMPVVGNAFSSNDSKKSGGLVVNSVGVGGGPGGGRGYGTPSEDGRFFTTQRNYEHDATGGISNVSPNRSRKLSFGRR